MLNGDSKLVLKDVKHVLDILLNLISVRKLNEKCYNNHLVMDCRSLSKDLLLWQEEGGVALCT